MFELSLVFALLVYVGMVVWYVRTPAFSLFHPFTFYAAFHGFVFVFRPFLGYLLDFRSVYQIYAFNPSLSDKATVILASTIGFVVFGLTSVGVGGQPVQFRHDEFTARERKGLSKILPIVLVIVMPLALYALYERLIGAAVGEAVAGMTLDKSTGAFINSTSVGYLTDIQLILPTCVALIAWFYRFQLWALMPLLIFAVVRAGTGGRGPMVLALAMTALLYFYDKRQKLPAAKAMIAAGVVFVAFTLVGIDRGAAVREEIGISSVETVDYARSDEKPLEGMHFANQEFFEYLVYVVPQRSGTYDMFLNNLQLFTEPIPRRLWPNKPIGAPIKRVMLFDYGYPIGMTFSLPGMGWYQLGYIGVIVWCGLWGLALGLLYRKFATGPQNRLFVAAYVIILSILIIAFRDGSMLTIVRNTAFYLLPIGVLAIVRRAARVPTADEATQRYLAEVRARRGAANAVAAGDEANAMPALPTEPAARNARALPMTPAQRRAMLAARLQAVPRPAE